MTSTSRLDPSRPAPTRVRRADRPVTATFRTPVRGHAFAARPPGARPVAAGLSGHLAREPDNPRDPLAVAVWADGVRPWRVGYLDRAVAARLAPRLDGGQRFVVAVDGWVDAPGSAWRRPLLRIEPLDVGAVDVGAVDVPPADGLAARPPGVRRRTVTPGR